MTDESVIGKLGTVILPIKKGRPGEINVKIRGGTEVFIAYADEDIDKNTEILVISQRSARTVDVTPF